MTGAHPISKWLGREFKASMFGYTYIWLAHGEVSFDIGGKAFIWCAPIKRLSGKPGRLRSSHIFFEENFQKS